MSMKKVLFITYHYPPSAEVAIYRTLKFNKYLKDLGWESHVLTTSNGKFAAYDPDLMKLIPEETVVHRSPSRELLNYGVNQRNKTFYSSNPVVGLYQKMLYGFKIFFSIPDMKMGWNRSAGRAACEIIDRENIPIVIISAPPFSSFLIAPRIKKRMPQVKILFDYRDPWTTNLEIIPFTDIHKKIHQQQEELALRFADGVICNTPTNRNTFLGQYSWFLKDRTITITNGYDEEDFRIRGGVTKNDEFTIAHAGTFYQHDYKRLITSPSIRMIPFFRKYRERKNDINEIMQYYSPKKFFKGVRAFLDEKEDARKRFRVKLIGRPGKNYERLVSELDLDEWVEFTGYVPYENNILETLRCHALLLTLSSGEESRGWIPSKMFQYLATGNPILCLVPEGDAHDIIEESGLGIFADQKDITSIKKAISFMYSKFVNAEGYAEPRWDSIEQYERKNLTIQLSEFMKKLVDNE